jgi:hypothetical protein
MYMQDESSKSQLVTVKVSPQVHDELFSYAGDLQQQLGRRVTISEAIETMLKSCQAMLGEVQNANLSVLNAAAAELKKVKKGRGRPPVRYTER